MKATKNNPIYTTYAVVDGNKYDLTPAVISLDFSEEKKQLSKSLQINLMQTQVDGTWLSGIMSVRSRIFIYADDGETKDEVFRGFIWARGYKSALDEREILLRCFDNLIYMQESEDSDFFSSGKDTKSILETICSKWGMKLEYTYDTITHGKLALRGNLSDIIIDDILQLVKDRTGQKYTILSTKDVMQIKPVGGTTYYITAKENAVHTKSECTMDGMITKVVILGTADDDDRQSVEATVSGDTAKYGTLQKIINRDSNTSLSDAKKEGQSIIDEDGKPKWEYEIAAPDIPWIRKGDKVFVTAGDLYKVTLLVTGIDRSISNSEKSMKITAEPM